MKTILFLMLIAAAAAADRPNIIIILADDMGYSDIGCYGSEIRTPNLDSLAARGARFSQFYTTPKCYPSRASLLTGLYPHQAGMGSSPLTFTHCVTIAEVLRAADYHTWMVGKWHGEDLPVNRGFERYFGLNDGAANHFNPGRQRPGEPPPAFERGPHKWAIDGRVFIPYTPDDPKFYSTDTYTDYALRYLSEQKDAKPFLLYVAYTAPHYPLQAWPEDIAKYRGKYMMGWDQVRLARHDRQTSMKLFTRPFPLAPRGNSAFGFPLRGPGPWLSRFADAEGSILPWDDVTEHDDWDLKISVYAAMVDRVDQNIGRLLVKLRELKKEENTLIIFLSDNGACAGIHHHGTRSGDASLTGPGPMESFHTYDAPWADASNTPFYGYKDTCYEGGIATPAVFCWPRGIRPQGIKHDVCHVMDIMPTCLELAGAQYPKTFREQSVHPFEGTSLVAILQGQRPVVRDTIFWEYHKDRAVRQGNWKLVSLPDKPWELYDLGTDRAEQHNLAHTRPELVRDLSTRWATWARRVGVELNWVKKTNAK
ncbi:MAG: arylsulfatase [Opitutaceae bacterium]|nr:arylsulfatase [Opitutaceae bacterium]